jgi:ribosome-associated translation inhibitor RaiA
MANIDIFGKDLEVTESLNSYVNQKIGKVIEKLGKGIVSSHVELRVHRFPLSGI